MKRAPVSEGLATIYVTSSVLTNRFNADIERAVMAFSDRGRTREEANFPHERYSWPNSGDAHVLRLHGLDLPVDVKIFYDPHRGLEPTSWSGAPVYTVLRLDCTRVLADIGYLVLDEIFDVLTKHGCAWWWRDEPARVNHLGITGIQDRLCYEGDLLQRLTNLDDLIKSSCGKGYFSFAEDGEYFFSHLTEPLTNPGGAMWVLMAMLGRFTDQAVDFDIPRPAHVGQLVLTTDGNGIGWVPGDSVLLRSITIDHGRAIVEPIHPLRRITSVAPKEFEVSLRGLRTAVTPIDWREGADQA